MSSAAGAARVASAARAAGGRLIDAWDRQLVGEVYRASFTRQTGVSLKYMMDFATSTAGHSKQQLLLSAQFLHREIPVRLAHRVAELENLPHGISSKPQVQTVRDWYVESFRELRDFKPIKNSSDEDVFTSLIKSIMKRHTNVVPMMAKGILELRRDLGSERALNDLPEIHKFLDGFYMSRIGIRMLLGQHVALHEPGRDGWIGLICTNLSPVLVAEEAVADARDVCLRRYGEAPEAEVFGDTNFTFAYVPSHLHQMLFELLKNSLRAVTEHFSDSNKAAPPIRVVIAEGDEDITIKVSDEGGGIPRSGLPNVWTYLYSTAESPLENFDVESEEGPQVVAGYGYGLPLARLYARYFGGDLQLISMEKYGTDAFLHLSRLGTSTETLP